MSALPHFLRCRRAAFNGPLGGGRRLRTRARCRGVIKQKKMKDKAPVDAHWPVETPQVKDKSKGISVAEIPIKNFVKWREDKRCFV